MALLGQRTNLFWAIRVIVENHHFVSTLQQPHSCVTAYESRPTCDEHPPLFFMLGTTIGGGHARAGPSILTILRIMKEGGALKYVYLCQLQLTLSVSIFSCLNWWNQSTMSNSRESNLYLDLCITYTFLDIPFFRKSAKSTNVIHIIILVRGLKQSCSSDRKSDWNLVEWVCRFALLYGNWSLFLLFFFFFLRSLVFKLFAISCLYVLRIVAAMADRLENAKKAHVLHEIHPQFRSATPLQISNYWRQYAR